MVRKRNEKIIVALSTINEEGRGRQIAHALVTEGLAACVNLVPQVTSIYRWEGKVQEEPEILMVIKTKRSQSQALEKRLRELHPYEVPEWIAWEIDASAKPYAQWVLKMTKKNQLRRAVL